jgi:hypothetical protein
MTDKPDDKVFTTRTDPEFDDGIFAALHELAAEALNYCEQCGSGHDAIRFMPHVTDDGNGNVELDFVIDGDGEKVEVFQCRLTPVQFKFLARVFAFIRDDMRERKPTSEGGAR